MLCGEVEIERCPSAISPQKFQDPPNSFSSSMPQRNEDRGGLKLPRQLQQELGIDLQGPDGRQGSRRNGFAGGRKERRKAERNEKKFGRTGNGRPQAPHSNASSHRRRHEKTVASNYEPDGQSTSRTSSKSARTKSPPAPAPKAKATAPKLKSILKKTLPAPILGSESLSSSDSGRGRSPSPGLVLDSSSRAFRDHAAHDVAEISALEKKLGLKSKKLPKSFEEDGLGELLEGLDSGDESRKRKREGDEWLLRKRRKAEIGDTDTDDVEDSSDLEEDEDNVSEPDENDEDMLEDSGVSEDDISEPDTEGDDFSGFDSDKGYTSPVRKVRENPFTAPVPPGAPSTKYVPPSLRKASDSNTESIQRLRRQIQGLLNKLSEANLISILSEVEKLYQSNARQEVTSTLTDLLLSLFCDPSSLQSSFVILHASFIAAVYKTIGNDFGAETISELVERLDRYYKEMTNTASKEAVNLISLLSHLYTFHVISSNLVFDYIRLFLEELSEANTELMLKVVRDVGPQLRQDDPSALKDIVRVMQNAVGKLAAEGREVNVRTKFMVETIADLKNNKAKAATGGNGVAIEHITRMRKVLGSLNTSNLRASEPMRFGRKDLQDSDKKGKWWLVGASWKSNDNANGHEAQEIDEGQFAVTGEIIDSEEADLLALARAYRMNTAVRRSIFVAIMSATDYQDAHLRLMKLRLKRSQEHEIARVVLRCAAAEEAYNPYYTLIASKLASEKKMKMAFQFSLWDFFKRMGEKGDLDGSDDEEDDEEQGVELKEIVNLAKMYGHLIAAGSLTLSILKVLNFVYLKDKAKVFVELLLVVVIRRSYEVSQNGADEKALGNILLRVADSPQVVKGLQYFIKKVVSRTDLAGTPKDQGTIRRGCNVALDTLKRLSMSTDRIE